MQSDKRPIGRPRLTQPRTINVYLRLTEDEAAAIKALGAPEDRSRAATIMRLLQQMLKPVR